MGPSIAYYFKRIYGNVIKWWFAVYNPVVRRIWPTKEEEEAALLEEEQEEAQNNEVFGDEELSADFDNTQDDFVSNEGYYEEPTYEEPAYEEPVYEQPKAPTPVAPAVNINDSNYNATTGAYSGLYGTGPVDSNTQSMFDEIMGRNNAAHSIDNLIPGNEPDYVDPDVNPPEDRQAVLDEANAIYERLMREAAEDEAKKQAEIDAAKAAQV